MDANKAMVVEDIAMDVFMSGPFLQWVSVCDFFCKNYRFLAFEDLKTNFQATGFMKWRDCFVVIVWNTNTIKTIGLGI